MSQSCSPELETLTIRCRPFYVPREFASFILIAVYIRPQAGAIATSQQLSAHITEIENSHPDSLVLVLGDSNRVSSRRALPWYKEHIFTATRGEKTLDQCYWVIPQAFHTVLRALLCDSNHNGFSHPKVPAKTEELLLISPKPKVNYNSSESLFSQSFTFKMDIIRANNVRCCVPSSQSIFWISVWIFRVFIELSPEIRQSYHCGRFQYSREHL